MNKDNDYFDDHDKYPKLSLLNEEIVKDDYVNASKKNNNNKFQQIELSDYQPLADDFDEKGKKPVFNPRNNNNNNNPTGFPDDNKKFNPFENPQPKLANQNNQSQPPPPPFQRPLDQNQGQQQPPIQAPYMMPPPPPIYILHPQSVIYQPASISGIINSAARAINPTPYQSHMAVTCPRCSLYQAIPMNSNGFICPRCNNVISVYNLHAQSRILVCDKCKSNVIFQVGSSPLIECTNCRTINYAAINDPQNIYGPKK